MSLLICKKTNKREVVKYKIWCYHGISNVHLLVDKVRILKVLIGLGLSISVVESREGIIISMTYGHLLGRSLELLGYSLLPSEVVRKVTHSERLFFYLYLL